MDSIYNYSLYKGFTMKKLATVFSLLAILLAVPVIVFAEGAGKALHFDGVNDYVTAGTPDIISTGGGNNGLTISAWIKATSFGQHDARIISKSIGVAEQDHYWMLSTFNSNGIKLRFRLKTLTTGTTTLIATSGDLSVGVWTHVAAVYDGSNMILYKDGVEVGRTAKSGTIATNNGIAAMIGNNAPISSSRPFDGLIEEVRLLSTGLTAQQLREEMHRTRSGNESHNVAYWRLNDGSGNTSTDNSGNGFIASLLNGTAWAVSTAPLGAGSSFTANVNSTGVVNFTGTSLIVNFTNKSGNDQIVSTIINNKPEGTQPAGVNGVYPMYWVVNKFGTGTFNASMSFATGNILPGDQASPGNLKLFRRDFNSDDTWTEIASGASATGTSVTFDGVTTPGQYSIGTLSDSPLPIQLASFTSSVVNGNSVRLDWTTISELNNYGFYVERRTDDEENFSELANSFLPGQGTTITPHDYTWTNEAVAQGHYYYRLRQIDLDGTIHYTDATEVTVGTLADVGNAEAPLEFRLAQNYPNPFNPSTRIQFSVEKSGEATLKVYNMIGQEVATLFSGLAESGKRYEVDFHAGNLANGVYMYQLRSNDNVSVQKMTLLK